MLKALILATSGRGFRNETCVFRSEICCSRMFGINREDHLKCRGSRAALVERRTHAFGTLDAFHYRMLARVSGRSVAM